MGRQEFKVTTRELKNVPGDLYMKLEFTPIPLIPWDWQKGVIEKLIYIFYHACEVKWEGTTAIVKIPKWETVEPNVEAARKAALDARRQAEEMME
jgi:hypothetical protein